MKRQKRIPAWFRIAIWSGIALAVISMLWVVDASGENVAVYVQ
jgi:hypothetical protein